MSEEDKLLQLTQCCWLNTISLVVVITHNLHLFLLLSQSFCFYELESKTSVQSLTYMGLVCQRCFTDWLKWRRNLAQTGTFIKTTLSQNSTVLTVNTCNPPKNCQSSLSVIKGWFTLIKTCRTSPLMSLSTQLPQNLWITSIVFHSLKFKHFSFLLSALCC